jgi:hypothetical protein
MRQGAHEVRPCVFKAFLALNGLVALNAFVALDAMIAVGAHLVCAPFSREKCGNANSSRSC